jgi:hydrogenase nickel incorporation protein HypA/HybF
MHELSLCQAIAASVAARAAGRPVLSVQVRIGHLRQVVPDALAFSWEVLTAGSALDGARLDVEHVPATVACAACDAVTTLDVPLLACRACGSHTVELRSGDELLVVSFEVADTLLAADTVGAADTTGAAGTTSGADTTSAPTVEGKERPDGPVPSPR